MRLLLLLLLTFSAISLSAQSNYKDLPYYPGPYDEDIEWAILTTALYSLNGSDARVKQLKGDKQFDEIHADAIYSGAIPAYDFYYDKVPLSLKELEKYGNAVDSQYQIDPITLEEEVRVLVHELVPDNFDQLQLKVYWYQGIDGQMHANLVKYAISDSIFETPTNMFMGTSFGPVVFPISYECDGEIGSFIDQSDYAWHIIDTIHSNPIWTSHYRTQVIKQMFERSPKEVLLNGALSGVNKVLHYESQVPLRDFEVSSLIRDTTTEIQINPITLERENVALDFEIIADSLNNQVIVEYVLAWNSKTQSLCTCLDKVALIGPDADFYFRKPYNKKAPQRPLFWIDFE